MSSVRSRAHGDWVERVLQTDWGLWSFKLRTAEKEAGAFSEPFDTRVAEMSGALGLPSNNDVKLYGTYIPLELPEEGKTPKGITGVHSCR